MTRPLGDPQALYENVYCTRGGMKNRIKKQQLGLFTDLTSCHDWWANLCRLLLASLAYVLPEAFRCMGLTGTELTWTQRSSSFSNRWCSPRNTCRIRFLLPEAYG